MTESVRYNELGRVKRKTRTLVVVSYDCPKCGRVHGAEVEAPVEGKIVNTHCQAVGSVKVRLQ